MPKLKGTRATAEDVKKAGASDKGENPPVITKEAGKSTTPTTRQTGKG